MAASTMDRQETRLNELETRLRRRLASLLQDRPVKLVYLFGSMVTGAVTPFSDVDIGLVVDNDLTPHERLKLILSLPVDLDDVISNADVRIINDAPLVFRGRVVSEGVLRYARDEQERVAFETATRTEYFDYLPIHKRLQDALFAGLSERGLYG